MNHRDGVQQKMLCNAGIFDAREAFLAGFGPAGGFRLRL